MRLPRWCMLGMSILLLVCEVAISQICKSLITLLDGFHTLFILISLALPPQTSDKIKHPPFSSLGSPASLQASSLTAEPPPGTHTSTNGSSPPDEPPTPQLMHGAASPFSSHQLCSPAISAPPLECGISYASSRVQVVGVFISSLLLASLCISYSMEIISISLKPHPVQRPLLLVVVGVVSLLHKMLVLRVNWGQAQEERARASRHPKTESHLEVHHKVLAEEETKSLAELGQVQDDVSQVQSAVDDSLYNGTLVLCNPGTSSVPDTDSETPQPKPGVQQHAASQDSRDCEDMSGGIVVLKACRCESRSKDIVETSKDNNSIGHLDTQNASKTSPVCKSSQHAEGQQPVRVLPFFLVIQGLFTSLLALINSLMMLLVGTDCLHSSGVCCFLVYLDPGLSLLAVIMLIAIAAPQVHRYGLLLLQATPPHICVSDLGRRIVGVPGVQAVHDLHVWQLTESFMVASVHVHCHAGFPAHRCADLMSGVTKVLQSVGVSCCTVQPEFASHSGSSVDSGGDTSPMVHREDPSLPPLLACTLSCGKACIGNMCCSPKEGETRSLPAPPAGETKEEPQILIIENTFV